MVAVLKRWKPHKTPKITASLTLYLLGLFAAFVARPPVTITDEMQTRYFEQMEAADTIDAEPRMEAERALLDAQMETRKAEVWFWWADSASREIVKERRTVERQKLDVAKRYRAARDAKVKQAKGELGLWSALGVDEVRKYEQNVEGAWGLAGRGERRATKERPIIPSAPFFPSSSSSSEKQKRGINHFNSLLFIVPIFTLFPNELFSSLKKKNKKKMFFLRAAGDPACRRSHCSRSRTSAANCSPPAVVTTTPSGSSWPVAATKT